MKDIKLTLLQYNVQKSQSVQELLLATSALQEVDIVALQELWKNPHLETSTSTVFSSFLPLYCSEIGRTLFLINKNLKLSSLHSTFWNKDLLRPLGWEPLIYRQSGRGPGKRTPWKSSDQPTRGHVTVETHTGGSTQHA